MLFHLCFHTRTVRRPRGCPSPAGIAAPEAGTARSRPHARMLSMASGLFLFDVLRRLLAQPHGQLRSGEACVGLARGLGARLFLMRDGRSEDGARHRIE
jgi:hypothetical protein